MKKIQIELSDKAIKELWQLKKKLNYPFDEDLSLTYEEYHKKMKSQKLVALFG